MVGSLGNFYETANTPVLLPGIQSSTPQISTSLPTTKEGYVKGVVMYTIMDDLTVTPMSTISIIAMLHKFNLGQVESLEEKVVKSSLESKTVLTDY
ncbi:hypothetical protein GOBAR_AA36512 [Gossypium barbadense]|uniref:Uncharacterized protein n=1 Tax=Gossypium barbadense TaxID=3634 RepID=A0A2P5VZH2_GOSBA|nr:hypothetical protein GOBAR_AA36512 [Gossypium barbadense]